MKYQSALALILVAMLATPLTHAQINTQNSAQDSAPGAAGPGDGAIITTHVGTGDTLWNVAERIRPDEASIEQVMVALVEANPAAFPSGNINDMRAGVDLRVPSVERMLGRSKARTARTIDYMNTAWRIRGPGGPVHVPLGPIDMEKTPPAAPGPTLSSSALDVARQLGTRAGASEADMLAARLEYVTGQRDALRDEVATLKTEMARLTEELALQEVELARQEATRTGLDAGGVDQQPARSPPGELAIARRGMASLISEYRWVLGGGVLLLAGLWVLWRSGRRPAADDSDDAMLGTSQAAGLAASRGDRAGSRPADAEEVAFETSSQDNTHSPS